MSEEQKKDVVVVRIRSSINLSDQIKNTLSKLRLDKPQSCIIIPNNPIFMGMLKKVQHIVTWGEVTPEIRKLLESFKTKKQTKILSFALHPPKGGYGRKGVKMPFAQGGALGYRGDKINVLVENMINGSQQKKEEHKA
jgi:large subunit ribosomal protein L30